MSVNLRRLATLVAVTAGVAAMAACGSSAKPGGSAGAAGVTAGKPAAAGGVEDGIGHPVNVCALLPVATVAQISGEPLTVANEDDTPSYKIYSCNYTSADGTSGLDVSVLAMDAAAGYDGGLQAAGTDAHQIGGLGDKAFSAITGLQALFGNVSITVSNLNSDDAAKKIIQTLQPKL